MTHRRRSHAVPLVLLLLTIAPAAVAQSTPRVFVESFLTCGGNFTNGLIEIDPETGDRRHLVGVEDVGGVCTPVGSGEVPFSIQWLGWDPTGAVWVADGNSGSGRLLRVGYPAAPCPAV